MSRKFFSLTFVLMILATLTASAQTLDEILQKYYDARGGYEKIKAIQTTKITGKQMVQGMEIPFVIYQKRPNLFRADATVQAQTIIQAYDGTQAWMVNPLTGSTDPVVLPEEQAKQFKEQSDFDGPLFDFKEKENTVELLGQEDMEGTAVFKIKITLKDGDVRYFFLDAEVFLELKVTSKMKQGETEFEIETFLSDYKEVNGQMVAHAVESKRGGTTISQISMETVEFDVLVDDSFFVMPIKSDVEKKQP